LRVEDLLLAVLALCLFLALGFAWWWFVLFLVPVNMTISRFGRKGRDVLNRKG
jgi:hypothetical protein